jgi:hypothetical protein
VSRHSTGHLFNPVWDSSQISVPATAECRFALTCWNRARSAFPRVRPGGVPESNRFRSAVPVGKQYSLTQEARRRIF